MVGLLVSLRPGAAGGAGGGPGGAAQGAGSAGRGIRRPWGAVEGPLSAGGSRPKVRKAASALDSGEER